MPPSQPNPIYILFEENRHLTVENSRLTVENSRLTVENSRLRVVFEIR